MKKIIAIGGSNSKESINKRFATYTANKIDNGEVSLEYYSPSQSQEWCDNEGNYYNRSGSRLRDVREFGPDEDGCYEPFGDE